MAKDKKKKSSKASSSRAEQVREAVEQAFEGVSSSPVADRAQELADDLASAASRFRDALGDLRLPAAGDDVKALREQVAKLERRVAVLEAAAKPGVPRRTTPAKRAPAKRTGGTTTGSATRAKRPPAS